MRSTRIGESIRECWELAMWCQLEWSTTKDSSLKAMTVYRGIKA